MKKLEINQMESFIGGELDGEACAGVGTAVALIGIGIGIATGGVGIAVGALLGSWLGVGSWMGCSSLL